MPFSGPLPPGRFGCICCSASHPGEYLGQGYPLFPGLAVTRWSVAFEAAASTLPIALAAAVALCFRPRVLALPVILLLWLWAASAAIHPFAIDFGTAWRGAEVLTALFLHPVHNPLALILVAATAAWILGIARKPRKE